MCVSTVIVFEHFYHIAYPFPLSLVPFLEGWVKIIDVN